MSRHAEHLIKVQRSGRTISDEQWEIIEPRHVEIWKLANKHFKEYSIAVGSQRYRLEADWQPLVRRHERHLEAMRRLDRNLAKKSSDPWKGVRFPRKPSIIRFKTKLQTKRPNEPTVFACASAIHDIFLIMNIAAPACCDFYLSSFLNEEYAPKISLSNVHFETGLNVFLDKGWPAIDFIELEKVTRWYNSVRDGSSQLPANPMAKALFAFLHISRVDLSPITVIWIFYAFESLFQTRAGENFHVLTRRICSLLETTPQQETIVKKKLRALYDIRSAIVHGGYIMPHPMHNEVLDERVNEGFEKLIDTTDYGFALLIASIQKTITNNWLWPKFTEQIEGQSSGE